METLIRQRDNLENQLMQLNSAIMLAESKEDKYVTLGKTYQIEGFSDETKLFSLRDDEGDIGSYTSACFKFHRAGDEK